MLCSLVMFLVCAGSPVSAQEDVFSDAVRDLKSTQAALQRAAVAALRSMKDPRCVAPLVSVLGNLDSAVREDALAGLAEIGAPAVLPLLIASRDQNPFISKLADKELKAMAPAVIEPLILILKAHDLPFRSKDHRTSDFRPAAADVLAEITGKDLGTDPATWWTWWLESDLNVQMKRSRELDRMAQALLEQKKTGPALALWEEAAGLAIQQESGLTANANALLNMGIAYAHAGPDYDLLAKETLFSAAESGPAGWPAYRALGDLYQEEKKPDEAIDNYLRWLEVRPNIQDADEIRQKIEQLRREPVQRAAPHPAAASPQMPPVELTGKKVTLVKIHPDLPGYGFMAATPEGQPGRIEIFQEGAGSLLQVIRYGDFGSECDVSLGGESALFSFEDVNFDGYQDLKFSCLQPGAGNQLFVVWLFDPLTLRFKYLADTLLMNPRLDPRRKEITARWDLGMGGLAYIVEYFKVIDGKPTLMKRERQGFDDVKNIWSRVTERRRRGEMKTVYEEIIVVP